MGPPFFTQLHQLFRFGQFSLTKRFRESFAHAVIVHRPDVGPAEIEKEQHLDGPTPNPTNSDQTRDDFFVAHLRQSARARYRPVDGFRSQILDRGDFVSRKTRAAQLLVRSFKNSPRIEILASRIESAHSFPNSCGSFSIWLLISDRLGQRVEWSNQS